MAYLVRHIAGDWGEVDEHDHYENELSLIHCFRLLSAYTLNSGTKIWIITEADRSVTTVCCQRNIEMTPHRFLPQDHS